MNAHMKDKPLITFTFTHLIECPNTKEHTQKNIELKFCTIYQSRKKTINRANINPRHIDALSPSPSLIISPVIQRSKYKYSRQKG
jgi:hypothetical protein